jgi:TolA-binding protein
MSSLLHPEDLLDREPEELSPSERALLEAHLTQCVACRLLVAAEKDFAAELAGIDSLPEQTAAMLSHALEVELHPEELLEREEDGELTDAERVQLDAHLSACTPCRLLRQARLDFAEELGSDLDAPLNADANVDDEDTAVIEARLGLRTGSKANNRNKVVPIRPTWRSRRRVGIAMVAAAAVLMLASVAVAARGTHVWAVIFAPSAAETPAPGPAATPAPTSTPKRVSKKGSAQPSQAAREGQEPDDVGTSEPSDESTAPSPSSLSLPVNVPSSPVIPAPVSIPAPTACAPVPVQAAPVFAPQAPSSARALRDSALPAYGTGSARSAGSADVVSAPGSAAAAVLFTAANDARRRGDHAAAARLYQDLISQHGTALESGMARVAMARMLLDDGDAQGALPLFEKYLEDGGGSLREEAMFGRARANQKLGRGDLEREAWEKLLASYPQSVHSAHAEARIKELSSR